MKPDPFTFRRLAKFCSDHRQRTGEFPTVRDFADAGFDKTVLDAGVKAKVIQECYVTLTNGTIMKGYRPI